MECEITQEQEFINMLEELNLDDFINDDGSIDVEYFSIRCEELS